MSLVEIKLLFVVQNEIVPNQRVVPNDSHENLLPLKYTKNTIPVIPLLLSFDKLIEV
jgi:hypothetical protein